MSGVARNVSGVARIWGSADNVGGLRGYCRRVARILSGGGADLEVARILIWRWRGFCRGWRGFCLGVARIVSGGGADSNSNYGGILSLSRQRS